MTDRNDNQNHHEFKRVLSTPHMVFYGLGTIIGAGIYVMVGKVAKEAGIYVPISFLLAATIAALTGLTYAELCSRFPKSAGAALYVERGFSRRYLTLAVGIGIAVTGIVSAATLANGFFGYFKVFFPDVPKWAVVVPIISLLGAIAIWGIRESVWIAAIITIIEVGGLILVLVVTGDSLGTLPARAHELVPPFDLAVLTGIMLGAFIAFYAFIGFEDMVNVAEEVRDPATQLPRAIIWAIVLSTLLYLLVAVTAVLALPAKELAASEAPLALLYQRSTGQAPVVISLISLFAVLNGALIQIIMASRIFFGMSREGWFPKVFAQMNTRRTPVFSISVVTAIVLLLAVSFKIDLLAKATNYIILLIFGLLHLALIRIKLRDPKPESARIFSIWIPAVGLVATFGIIIFQTLRLAF